MKITVTEEMREALRLRRKGMDDLGAAVPPTDLLAIEGAISLAECRLARLVAEAVEREE